MYLTKELAFEIETCIKETHLDMARSVPIGKVLEIGEGAACFAGASSFFSQVIAWGFKLKPKQFKIQIELIEEFYRSCGHLSVDIELCPLVGNDLPMALSERGYQITELSTISFLDLTTHLIHLDESPFSIREVVPDEIEQWAKTVALGFGHLDAQDQFINYARLKGVHVYAAYDKQQIIAGATIARHGVIADLGVTSTLPAYRNQGIQKLLLNERIRFANKEGISLLTVTTQPGSISDINVQKIGFHCAYTRIKFTRILK